MLTDNLMNQFVQKKTKARLSAAERKPCFIRLRIFAFRKKLLRYIRELQIPTKLIGCRKKRFGRRTTPLREAKCPLLNAIIPLRYFSEKTRDTALKSKQFRGRKSGQDYNFRVRQALLSYGLSNSILLSVSISNHSIDPQVHRSTDPQIEIGIQS